MNKKLIKTIGTFVEKNKMAVANGLDEENPYSGRMIVYEDSIHCTTINDAVGSIRSALGWHLTRKDISVMSFVNHRASTAETFEDVYTYPLDLGWLVVVSGERTVHFLDAQIWGPVK